MEKIHRATPEDMRKIQDAFKLYKGLGKFTYVRKDYIERSIKAGDVFLDHGTLAFIHRMARSGWMGTYKYSAGEWNVHQILSTNRSKPNGPYIFLKHFVKDVAGDDRIFGCIHDTNETSMKFHKAFGFKECGKISWSNESVKGTVVYLDPNHSMDKFVI